MASTLAEYDKDGLLIIARQYLVQKILNIDNILWIKMNEQRITEEIRIMEEAREGYKKSHPNDGLILNFIDYQVSR